MTEEQSWGRATTEERVRPTTWKELRFKCKSGVRWFSPSVLATAAQRVAISSAFGDFLDKRELQNTLAIGSIMHPLGRDEKDVWIDFIADTGDGFNATYSVAWLAAQRRLALADHQEDPLPRASLVVFGGDEVYPVATPEEYENRFMLPYEASLPHTDSPHPTLLAIPGNHDWYDGLTSFMRMFAQPRWVGGRQTRQSRSYFAVQLPHRWWLWGIDIALETYIDEPQLKYFDAVAKEMGPGARVILCTAVPAWTEVEPNKEGFRDLAYLEAHVVRKHGLELMVSLSGDSHHYVRYQAEDGTQKITAGGGGAFLHPTHHLPDVLEVPTDPTFEQTKVYEHQRSYPDRKSSRRLSFGALALPWRNRTFVFIPALLYLVLGFASQFAIRTLKQKDDFDTALRDLRRADVLATFAHPVSIVLLLVVLALLYGFAKPWARASRGRKKMAAKFLMGVTHLVIQIGLFVVVALLVVDLAAALARGTAFFVLNAVLLGAAGAVVGSLALGLYLALWCAFGGAHGNEAFSAVSYSRYKNFLRMHIGGDGTLTIYPIGLDRANTEWGLDPDAATKDAPWIKPRGKKLAARLIESPIKVPSRP